MWEWECKSAGAAIAGLNSASCDLRTSATGLVPPSELHQRLNEAVGRAEGIGV
jgi:hypothetical protein